jgi:hypothetical protein
MTDTREAIQAAGEILIDFLKSGPKSSNHRAETKTKIYEVALSIVTNAEEATASYEQFCKEFLDKVVQVKGMPTRTIFSDEEKQAQLVSSSGSHISQNFDALLPSIRERFEWCISNYNLQAKRYLDEQLSQFQALLEQFIEQVPIGGTKDKAIKSQVSEIKKELRQLAKWDKLFNIYKAISFPAEIEYLFALEGNPIAAIWRYSQADEQGEYRKTYSHKERDGRVYVVRDNWAIGKGLMTAEPYGYIDEISHPNQEIGCMCHLQWVYNIRDLPKEMVTEKGVSALKRARALMQTESEAQKPNIAVEPETGRSGLKNLLMRWIGRG